MIHEHQFQRQHRTAPRQHFSGGHVGHGGQIEPLGEYPSFKREAAVVIPAIVVGMVLLWAVAVVW